MHRHGTTNRTLGAWRRSDVENGSRSRCRHRSDADRSCAVSAADLGIASGTSGSWDNRASMHRRTCMFPTSTVRQLLHRQQAQAQTQAWVLTSMGMPAQSPVSEAR